MKALLLGGAGFIGLHLARRLVADGLEVTIVDDFSRGRSDADLGSLRSSPAVHVISADLTDPAAYAGLPTGWNQIYLLAAVVGVRNVEQNPARVVRVNTLAAMHLLDWVAPGSRVFFASTSEVYAGGVDAGVVAVPTAEDVPTMISDITAPPVRVRGEQAPRRGGLPAHRAGRGVRRRRGPLPQRLRPADGRRPRHPADHVIPEMSLRAGAGEDPFQVPGPISSARSATWTTPSRRWCA